MNEVSDTELKKVIGDFLDMGHVENIVAMFRRDASYYDWTGELLNDERLNVRLGMAILFEELRELQPEKLDLAVPSLTALLDHESATIRGDAIGVLGIIGSDRARALIAAMRSDPSPQVREMVRLTLEEI